MKLLDYSTKTITNKCAGGWNTTTVEILKSGIKVGQYDRNYHSYAENTFFAFSHAGKEYALISREYSTIELITLPDCLPVELKKECKEQLMHFCPTSIHVPASIDYSGCNDESVDTFQLPKDFDMADKAAYEKKQGIVIRSMQYGNFAFVLGCVWGDDSSWKLNMLDLSLIEKGELWYVNNELKREWLYEEFPDSVDLKDIECWWSRDGVIHAYNQLIQKYVDLDFAAPNHMPAISHEPKKTSVVGRALNTIKKHFARQESI